MDKQWQECLSFKSVEPLEEEESLKVRAGVKPERILRSRCVQRDKNSDQRTAENDLRLKAKARLAIAVQDCPDARSDFLRTDAPTVQRTSGLRRLQVAANLDWLGTLKVGDISSAFLQGRPREVDDPICMEQPRGYQLPGRASSRCLIKVLKGVFGLPDALRAWWAELSRALTKDLKFEQSQLDQAF